MTMIKMARTERGSRDGLTVDTFVEGVEYDIPDALVVAFRTMGVLDEPQHGPAETPESAAPAMDTPEAPRRGRPRKAKE